MQIFVNNSSVSPIRTWSRRYDLDWFRSIIILNLIPYHVAFLMLAVPEFSSVSTEGNFATLLAIYLIICTPLHMPLMFMIAGYSMTMTIAHKPLHLFSLGRIQRLVIPLVLLTLILMPLATYALPVLAHISPPNPPSLSDYFGRYWPQMMAQCLTVSITGGPPWLHLWFVAYLSIMTALSAPIIYQLKSKLILLQSSWERLQNQSLKWEYSILFVAFLGFIAAFLLARTFPFYRFNLVRDWAYFFYNAIAFTLGILLVWKPRIAELITYFRTPLTIAVVITLILRLTFVLYCSLQFDADLPEVYATKLPGMLYEGYAVIAAANTWTTLLALWSWGQTRWNQASRILTYLSQRSYSYYIWHFVILCIVGREIVRWHWDAASEFMALCLTTAIATFLADEILVQRWAIGRKLFGIKSIYR
ncbi:MAG: hypothetical protein EAZ61_11505 [Oscillatoriales cyanobacterium]|nr:MAG: hypothetical protein EAZ61_11505 [Oscillatoriales cyanobacterium]